MPRVLEFGKYIIFFWIGEDGEPVHVHVSVKRPMDNSTKIEHVGGAVQRVERRGGDGRQGGKQAQPTRNRGMYIWRACRGLRGQVAPLLRAGPTGRYPRGGLAPRLYSDSVPDKLVYPRPGQKTVCRRWV